MGSGRKLGSIPGRSSAVTQGNEAFEKEIGAQDLLSGLLTFIRFGPNKLALVKGKWHSASRM